MYIIVACNILYTLLYIVFSMICFLEDEKQFKPVNMLSSRSFNRFKNTARENPRANPCKSCLFHVCFFRDYNVLQSGLKYMRADGNIQYICIQKYTQH